MNFMNSNYGSPRSKHGSMRATRTFMARLLIMLGMCCANLAARIAPWLDE